MKKRKTKTVIARVVGPIPHVGYKEILWKVRIVAPRFPFSLDSQLCYPTKEKAEEVAAKWRKKKVTIKVEG